MEKPRNSMDAENMYFDIFSVRFSQIDQIVWRFQKKYISLQSKVKGQRSKALDLSLLSLVLKP